VDRRTRHAAAAATAVEATMIDFRRNPPSRALALTNALQSLAHGAAD
jgi:hypothetical protein